MSRKLLVLAMACGLGAAAPAWAANGPPASADRGQQNKAEKGSICQGYSSKTLKAACQNDRPKDHHPGGGKGHCKGVGVGHDRGHGHGHDKDDDCPVSS